MSPSGGVLYRATLDKLEHRWATQARIKKRVTEHVFRHSVAALYVEELRARRYSVSALDKAQLELGRLAHHLREKTITDARAVTEAHFLGYALSVIRRFYASLEARGLMLQNPARILSLPRLMSLPRAAS